MKPIRNRKILLVEDDPVTSLATSSMLKSSCYDVVASPDGRQAVETFSRERSIDLVIMDIELGEGLDGPGAAKIMLDIRDVPIVFFTAHTGADIAVRVSTIKRYGYVIKNSGDSVLLSSIEMAFELFESHERLLETSGSLARSEKSIRRRLETIMHPGPDVDSLDLADVVDVSRLQLMSDDFNRLTGIPMGIFDARGNCLVAAGWQDICTRFHRANPESNRCCLESDTILTRGVRPGEYREYRCKNNMRDIVTPIMHGERHIGNVFLGQFLYDDEDVDVEVFRKQAAYYHYDEQEYLDALRRVQRMSRNKVQAFLSYYTRLADMISQLSFSNIKLARAVADRDKSHSELMEKDSMLRLITDNMVDLVSMMDKDLRFRYISPSFERVLGYSPADLTGRKVLEHIHPEDIEMVRAGIDDLISTGFVRAEFRYMNKAGEYLWFEASGRVIMDVSGDISGAVVGGREITARVEFFNKLVRREKEIQNLLEQKEMLLREVHHRIKNNMNTIAGLLNLQSLSIKDDTAVEALKDARGRVQNMMLIYDKLYRSADYKNLQVVDYFENLVDEIVKIFPNHQRVSVTKRIDDFRLDSKVLFTMGIMINELITNAYKYAFDGIESPELFFSLSRDREKIRITVRDNGRGLPEHVKSGGREGFGLRLVSELAGQLEGSMTIGECTGTEITIVFVLDV